MSLEKRPSGGRNGLTLHLIAAIAVGIAALAVYAPTLGYNFINWDDRAYIPENPLVRSLSFANIIDIFSRPVLSNWHPLTILSFAMDYRFWYLDPRGYHLTNAVFHALNAILVYFLTVRLVSLASKGGAPPARLVLTGLFSAAIFALHPLHVESVAWVAERKDVLYSFFFILSVLAYIRYSGNNSYRWYWASLFLFLLSLLSKPMAITLPAVLLILDFYPLERVKNLKLALLEKLPFLLLSAAFAYMTVLVQEKAFAREGLITFTTKVFVALRALAFYLYKTLVPSGLAPYYPHPVRIDVFTFEYSGAALFFIVATALSIVLVKWSKAFLAAWLYYMITLSPVLGILQVGGQAAADRYTYLTTLSITVVFSFGVVRFLEILDKKRFIAATVLLAILSSALAWGTVRQASVWKDSFTLWSHEIEKFPYSHVALSNRGVVRQESGDLRGAIEDFTRAIESAPEIAEPYNNRGAAYQTAGDYASAVEDYKRALAIAPGLKGVNYNLGLSYSKLGDYASAIESYSRELRNYPGDTEALLRRGFALRDAGLTGKAIDDFTAAIALSPSNSMAYAHRGTTLYSVKNFQLALDDFERALRIDPSNKAALYYGAICLSNLGREAEAVEYLRRASDLGLKEASELLAEYERKTGK